jgi:hypothetical protein
MIGDMSYSEMLLRGNRQLHRDAYKRNRFISDSVGASVFN